MKKGDKVVQKCRKCGKPVEQEVTDVILGSIPCFNGPADCGGHKKEWEEVKGDYRCYIDFLYNMPKKVKKVGKKNGKV